MKTNNNKIGCWSMAAIILFVLFIFSLFNNENNNDNTNTSNQIKNESVSKFIVTESMGVKLPQNATFYIPTDGSKWSLDYNNGDVIYYELLTLNKHNMLCGIKALDSFGDECEICITPVGESAIITMKYGNKTITYKGYPN